jgi:hypothetical protein
MAIKKPKPAKGPQFIDPHQPSAYETRPETLRAATIFTTTFNFLVGASLAILLYKGCMYSTTCNPYVTIFLALLSLCFLYNGGVGSIAALLDKMIKLKE